MRKELIITIIIVIFVIIGNCITQKYTQKCVSETTSQLEELKKIALDGEKDHNELAKMAKDIYEQWVKKNEGLF